MFGFASKNAWKGELSAKARLENFRVTRTVLNALTAAIRKAISFESTCIVMTAQNPSSLLLRISSVGESHHVHLAARQDNAHTLNGVPDLGPLRLCLPESLSAETRGDRARESEGAPTYAARTYSIAGTNSGETSMPMSLFSNSKSVLPSSSGSMYPMTRANWPEPPLCRQARPRQTRGRRQGRDIPLAGSKGPHAPASCAGS